MSSKHTEKFVTKLLLGFACVTSGIMLIFYVNFERKQDEDWYFWGIVASVLINGGLYFLLNAFVHKIKSDFIKRQRLREQQKTFTQD